jgi:hypothetical protein
MSMLSSRLSEIALDLNADMKAKVISYGALFDHPIKESRKWFRSNPESPCTTVNVLMDYLAEQYGLFNRKHFRDVVKRGVKSPHWFRPTTQKEE